MKSRCLVGSFPHISTVFDSKGDDPHSLLYSGSIRSTLLRLLPADLFYALEEGEVADLEFTSEFNKILPVFRWSEWEGSQGNISLFLLTQHRPDAVKFFYDMISRWLIPGRRVHISSFFATDFQFPQHSTDVYTLSEMVISLEFPIERVRQYLRLIESEIKLGLISVYHANRILEIKGLSSDEKTSLVQERISRLLVRRPKDFDYDIFSQMQHFLVMCTEEFKAGRSYRHMSRIIYVFYLFRQKLKDVESRRLVFAKLSQTHLYLPLGMRRVVSVFVGLNFLNDNELFEERHLIKVLNALLPAARHVEGSYFSSTFKEEKTQLLYLEIEKEDKSEFSLQEMKMLRERLPEEVKKGVEKMMHPLFMPRNEEEVMRNIITLSKQLRYPKDLPQAIISFNEQSENELSFTIILLRLVHENHKSIQEQFASSKTPLKYALDRVKIVGVLRKRYSKEATVFRVAIAEKDFLRTDHSLDLFRARQVVLQELQNIVGEIRDYNGGMIAKQHEQFLALKALFPSIDKREGALLENLFHSIFPVELRSLLQPSLVKGFFNLLLELMEQKTQRSLFKVENGASYVVFFSQNDTLRQNIFNSVSKLHLPASQLITISSPESYFGFILRETEGKKCEEFIGLLKQAQNLTFDTNKLS